MTTRNLPALHKKCRHYLRLNGVKECTLCGLRDCDVLAGELQSCLIFWGEASWCKLIISTHNSGGTVINVIEELEIARHNE
jgi:hypothetical protein